ncbi:hypothetical protein [Streptomyces sp. NPDC046887]|uniref:hypothetical protein n=1 Tax=Streptomyces sp. NPDC046887 TaxID=3155472 RepID=UPI0033CE83AF
MNPIAVARRLLGPVALAGLLAVGCAGCGETRACTSMGGRSGVSADWNADAFADAAGVEPKRLSARLCVGEVCASRPARTTAASDAPPSDVDVRLADDIGEKRVQVRLTVRVGSGGDILFDERTNATLRPFRPNGEGCSPTLYRASVTADPEQGLSAAP